MAGMTQLSALRLVSNAVSLEFARKLARRWRAKGLIERDRNPDDKHGHSLSVSTTGAEKIPVLARMADDNDAAFFAVLSGEAHESLYGLLCAPIDRHGLSVMPVD